MKNKKYAYCTLLSTENYIDAVLVLNKSLQTVNSKYPLAVMVTLSIYSENLKNLLEKNGMICIPVMDLKYSKKTEKIVNVMDRDPNVLNTASKMNIFNLKQWDKLVYIDADSMVLKNIDDLFDYRDGSMVYFEEDEMGFSAMFVISPKNHIEFPLLKLALENTEWFDGQIIGTCWFYILENKDYQIPTYYFPNYSNHLDENVRAVHYCNKIKPWIHEDYPDFNLDYEICHLYKKYLKEVREIKGEYL